jgi:ATP-dependent RNA/DNA helicase IGHMBP2
MLNQEITETATGLYGRVLVTLEPKNRTAQIQPSSRATKFSAGDIVGLRAVADPGPEGLPVERGVISRVAKNRIQIALSQPPNETLASTWDIVQLTNQVTFKRMSRALASLSQYSGPALGAVALLLGQRAPDVQPRAVSAVPGLNPPQCEAIAFALSESPVTLIEGPPGTGKTTTVAALIGQAVAAGQRVLATAPSNVAVDNLIEKLVALPGPKLRLVRLGHPARLLRTAVDYSLDALYQESNVREVCEDVRQEMEQLREEIKSARGGGRKHKWEQWRGLQRELKQRQVTGLTALVQNCQVVLAT